MNVKILCIGKLKEKYLKDACEEYAKRLSRYCKFNITELDEYKTSDNPTQSQIDAVIENEGEKIISKLPKNAKVVTLCIEGEQKSSEQLANYINNCAVKGFCDIVFVIGGSWGLSDKVKALSDLRLSMSKMTFPHQLARVMLCEQIYRSFNILNGGKYHK